MRELGLSRKLTILIAHEYCPKAKKPLPRRQARGDSATCNDECRSERDHFGVHTRQTSSATSRVLSIELLHWSVLEQKNKSALKLGAIRVGGKQRGLSYVQSENTAARKYGEVAAGFGTKLNFRSVQLGEGAAEASRANGASCNDDAAHCQECRKISLKASARAPRPGSKV